MTMQIYNMYSFSDQLFDYILIKLIDNYAIQHLKNGTMKEFICTLQYIHYFHIAMYKIKLKTFDDVSIIYIH